MKRQIRMGMVGGGPGAFIGEVHRMAARLDNKIKLVCGTFSSDYEKTKQIGADLFLEEDRLYPDYQTMMKAEATRSRHDRMDFVSIVTPNHIHLAPAIDALNAGFHVMSDKPATFDLKESIILQKIVEKTGLLYGLTHTYLGYPMVKHARFMVADGMIGIIRKIIVEYPQGWLSRFEEGSGKNKQAEWRTDPKRSGISGSMGDIGSHAHSLVEYITGQIMTHVSADLNIFVKGRKLDDDGSVLFRMDGGARGTLTASQICAGEENALKIKIYGENGGLEWHQQRPYRLYHKPYGKPVEILSAGVDKQYLSDAARRACRIPSGHPEGYLEAFANLYSDFADAIANKGHDNSLIGIKEAVRGMAFIEAVVENNETNDKWTKINIIR